MTFTIVSVIKSSDFADDRMFPSPTGARDYPLRLGSADSNVATFFAHSLHVTLETGGTTATAYRLAQHSVRLLVTDDRVAVFCRDYDKGGGWTGTGLGVLFAGLFNSVSRTAANVRSAGKVLAGHVRYQWLVEAGGSANGRELLLRVRDGDTTVTMRLMIAKPHDANEVARDIIMRAAKHHLSGDQQLTFDQRQRWTSLLSATPLPANAGRISSWKGPNFYRPTESTVPYPAANTSAIAAEDTSDPEPDVPSGTADPVVSVADITHDIADATRVRPRRSLTPEPSTVPAGWYDDGHGFLRWWDGTQWTEHTQSPSNQTVPSRITSTEGPR